MPRRASPPPWRNTKYTPERVQCVLEAVALGATYRLACLYAGITDDTLANWRRRHPDFAVQLAEAEGRATVGWLTKIEDAAANGEWTAAAWKLERRYPAEYGRRIQELTTAPDAPLRIEYVNDWRRAPLPAEPLPDALPLPELPPAPPTEA